MSAVRAAQTRPSGTFVERRAGSFQRKRRSAFVLEGLRGEETIAEWFATTWQAQIVINQWLRKYNHVRSHEALSTRVPVPEIIQRTAN